MSEVEQNIVSVERILHYVKLEPEAPAEIPGVDPEGWPSKGEVEFKDYSTRYRPGLDLVLKNINIKIVRDLQFAPFYMRLMGLVECKRKDWSCGSDRVGKIFRMPTSLHLQSIES